MNKALIFSGLIFIFVIFSVLVYRHLHSHHFNKVSVWLALKMDEKTIVEPVSQHALPYRIFSPRKKSLEKKYPLVVVLHGAGGRGDDNKKQLNYPSYYFTSGKVQKQYPSYVVVPQCPNGLEWNDIPAGPPPFVNYDMNEVPVSWREDAIAQLTKKLVRQYPIDPDRIYIVGDSMGSSGIWSLLVHKPDLFSAALPINGRGDPAMASHIHTPVWSFHGDKDPVAPLKNSEQMIAALHALNKPAKLSVINGGHNISKQALHEGSLAWLFSHHKDSVNIEP